MSPDAWDTILGGGDGWPRIRAKFAAHLSRLVAGAESRLRSKPFARREDERKRLLTATGPKMECKCSAFLHLKGNLFTSGSSEILYPPHVFGTAGFRDGQQSP